MAASTSGIPPVDSVRSSMSSFTCIMNILIISCEAMGEDLSVSAVSAGP